MEGMALTEAVYYILLSLVQPLHGYGIMQRAEALSGGRVKLAAGTLYGALSTLQERGWIEALPEPRSSRKKGIPADPPPEGKRRNGSWNGCGSWSGTARRFWKEAAPMKDKLVKYRVYVFWDYDKEEEWLGRMAEQGYELEDACFCRYIFRKGKPGAWRYKMEFLEHHPLHRKGAGISRFPRRDGHRGGLHLSPLGPTCGSRPSGGSLNSSPTSPPRSGI